MAIRYSRFRFERGLAIKNLVTAKGAGSYAATAACRVGHMPYLNSAVFYQLLRDDRLDLISLPPRNMAHAMIKGELDAGPLPIAEVLRMNDHVTPLSDFGVATDGPARSVILVSQVPAEELGGRAVAVTAQTSTSVQLLRILFDQLWSVEGVALEGPEAECDARLLIGDDALKHIYGGTETLHVYDLSLGWKRLTSLPFVFARWVVRSDMDRESILALERQLTVSYEAGISKIEDIASAWSIAGMPTSHIVEYVKGFTYRLGSKELKAIDEFESMLAKMPEWLPPIYPMSDPTASRMEVQ